MVSELVPLHRGLPYAYDLAMVDTYTDAQFVYHVDSDMMWVRPVTLDELFRDGKPAMYTTPFSALPPGRAEGAKLGPQLVEKAARPGFFQTFNPKS